MGGEAFHVLIEVSNSRSERLFLADRGRGYAWSFEATQGEETRSSWRPLCWGGGDTVPPRKADGTLGCAVDGHVEVPAGASSYVHYAVTLWPEAEGEIDLVAVLYSHPGPLGAMCRGPGAPHDHGVAVGGTFRSSPLRVKVIPSKQEVHERPVRAFWHDYGSLLPSLTYRRRTPVPTRPTLGPCPGAGPGPSLGPSKVEPAPPPIPTLSDCLAWIEQHAALPWADDYTLAVAIAHPEESVRQTLLSIIHGRWPGSTGARQADATVRQGRDCRGGTLAGAVNRWFE